MVSLKPLERPESPQEAADGLIDLRGHFDRVVLISLPDRADRRQRARKELTAAGFDPGSIQWLPAIRGDTVLHPDWWRAGNGAWGCWNSHYIAVVQALMDGCGSILVLEDDLRANPHASAGRFLQFMKDVPHDWEMLYLGGQHWGRNPSKVPGNPGILRPFNVNRTHAYALSGAFMNTFLRHITNFADYISSPKPRHIDHQLGALHEERKHKIFTPPMWVFGQSDGTSNISGATDGERWWHPSTALYSQKFALFDRDELVERYNADPEHWEELLAPYHFGNHRNGIVDCGLGALVGEALKNRDREPPANRKKLIKKSPCNFRQWSGLIAKEALHMGKTPATLVGHVFNQTYFDKWWPAGTEFVTLKSVLAAPEVPLFRPGVKIKEAKGTSIKSEAEAEPPESQ